VIREKQLKTLLYKNSARKMLMKLTPAVTASHFEALEFLFVKKVYNSTK